MYKNLFLFIIVLSSLVYATEEPSQISFEDDKFSSVDGGEFKLNEEVTLNLPANSQVNKIDENRFVLTTGGKSVNVVLDGTKKIVMNDDGSMDVDKGVIDGIKVEKITGFKYDGGNIDFVKGNLDIGGILFQNMGNGKFTLIEGEITSASFTSTDKSVYLFNDKEISTVSGQLVVYNALDDEDVFESVLGGEELQIKIGSNQDGKVFFENNKVKLDGEFKFSSHSISSDSIFFTDHASISGKSEIFYNKDQKVISLLLDKNSNPSVFKQGTNEVKGVGEISFSQDSISKVTLISYGKDKKSSYIFTKGDGNIETWNFFTNGAESFEVYHSDPKYLESLNNFAVLGTHEYLVKGKGGFTRLADFGGNKGTQVNLEYYGADENTAAYYDNTNGKDLFRIVSGREGSGAVAYLGRQGKIFELIKDKNDKINTNYVNAAGSGAEMYVQVQQNNGQRDYVALNEKGVLLSTQESRNVISGLFEEPGTTTIAKIGNAKILPSNSILDLSVDPFHKALEDDIFSSNSKQERIKKINGLSAVVKPETKKVLVDLALREVISDIDVSKSIQLEEVTAKVVDLQSKIDQYQSEIYFLYDNPSSDSERVIRSNQNLLAEAKGLLHEYKREQKNLINGLYKVPELKNIQTEVNVLLGEQKAMALTKLGDYKTARTLTNNRDLKNLIVADELKNKNVMEALSYASRVTEGPYSDMAKELQKELVLGVTRGIAISENKLAQESFEDVKEKQRAVEELGSGQWEFGWKGVEKAISAPFESINIFNSLGNEEDRLAIAQHSLDVHNNRAEGARHIATLLEQGYSLDQINDFSSKDVKDIAKQLRISSKTSEIEIESDNQLNQLITKKENQAVKAYIAIKSALNSADMEYVAKMSKGKDYDISEYYFEKGKDAEFTDTLVKAEEYYSTAASINPSSNNAQKAKEKLESISGDVFVEEYGQISQDITGDPLLVGTLAVRGASGIAKVAKSTQAAEKLKASSLLFKTQSVLEAVEAVPLKATIAGLSYLGDGLKTIPQVNLASEGVAQSFRFLVKETPTLQKGGSALLYPFTKAWDVASYELEDLPSAFQRMTDSSFKKLTPEVANPSGIKIYDGLDEIYDDAYGSSYQGLSRISDTSLIPAEDLAKSKNIRTLRQEVAGTPLDFDTKGFLDSQTHDVGRQLIDDAFGVTSDEIHSVAANARFEYNQLPNSLSKEDVNQLLAGVHVDAEKKVIVEKVKDVVEPDKIVDFAVKKPTYISDDLQTHREIVITLKKRSKLTKQGLDRLRQKDIDDLKEVNLPSNVKDALGKVTIDDPLSYKRFMESSEFRQLDDEVFQLHDYYGDLLPHQEFMKGPTFSQKIYYEGETYETPYQGWKLRVSSDQVNARKVLEIAQPYLDVNNIRYKVAHNLDNLDVRNKLNVKASQSHKFITIYPENDEAAVKIAHELDFMFADKDMNLPKAPTDKVFGKSGAVSYRYGMFKPGNLRKPDGSFVEDVREAGKYKPDWIQENPLAEIRQDLYKRPAILSKESTTDMVQNAKSFKELILIAEENPIRGTYNVFNNNLLERSLNDVLYGKTPIMQITRSNGLRDKAIALFREEGYSFDANGYIFLDDFIDEAAARTDSFEIIKGIANGFSG